MNTMTSTTRPRVRKPNICMRCGSSQVLIEHRSDVVAFKGLTLEAEGLVETVFGTYAKAIRIAKLRNSCIM